MKKVINITVLTAICIIVFAGSDVVYKSTIASLG